MVTFLYFRLDRWIRQSLKVLTFGTKHRTSKKESVRYTFSFYMGALKVPFRGLNFLKSLKLSIFGLDRWIRKNLKELTLKMKRQKSKTDKVYL